MPTSHEWIETPLEVVQKFYDECGNKEYIVKANEFYASQLAVPDNIRKIPSLNDVPTHIMKANSLVRFRCIIQDMSEPEIFLSEYESVNKTTGQSVMRVGAYKDVADCREEEEVRCESSRNVMGDRQVYYCVPVPAETAWVKKEYACVNHMEPSPSTSGENQSRDSFKRTHDDRMCPGSPESVISSTCSTLNEDSDGTVTETDEQMDTTDGNSEPGKRTKLNNNGDSSRTLPLGPDLNFPLPDEKGPACIVKVYEKDGEALKVTDMVEFIGVLSVDPTLNTFHDHGDGNDPLNPMLHDEAELRAHCPPPSLVPRLHCLVVRKLNHNNPLVGPALKIGYSDKASTKLLCEAKEIRTELVSVLEQMVFGDTLTAEYLLCHLLSTVYARRDILPLGKFSLNISNCPKSVDLASFLSRLLESILTQVHYLPMSLTHMNERLLSPKKDYTANRLRSGVLQMGQNTQLVVDETALESGQLNDTGVKNVTALGNLIKWQKVEYDMIYYQSDFMANMQVLVVSEGKSLLPTDCRVPLAASGDTSTIRERYSAITQYLTPALLTRLRAYITIIQNTEYTISEQMQKVLEQHFVESRKDDPKLMTNEDFNVLLVLTRLQSLSYGEPTLSLDVWNRTKELEKERQTRLA